MGGGATAGLCSFTEPQTEICVAKAQSCALSQQGSFQLEMLGR
jgi:hypothetical protein